MASTWTSAQSKSSPKNYEQFSIQLAHSFDQRLEGYLRIFINELGVNTLAAGVQLADDSSSAHHSYLRSNQHLLSANRKSHRKETPSDSSPTAGEGTKNFPQVGRLSW
ncbi:hypothetical protein E2C01_068247 [Portunus trituberculatus]|uniref:Uncharacterized protein n=1 Tax=Portunus trituberculatus TaxID=210409 RepID=A0A5B7HVR9_PORTR|nr:hypothetical protein [Portunus trituberculatus]